MLRLKIWPSYTHRNRPRYSVEEVRLFPGLISRLCTQLQSLVLLEFKQRLLVRPPRSRVPTLTEVTPLHRHVRYKKNSSAIITDLYDNGMKYKRCERGARSFTFRAGGI